VTLSDRFDRDGETWGLADWDSGFCWVPMSLLERGAATGARPPDRLNPEIDLPAGALASRRAQQLVASGVVEVLDREDEAVGVAFHLELQGPTLVSLVEELRDDARRAVAEQMNDVVEDLAPHDDDAALDDAEDAGGDDVALEEPDEGEED
jgi:hypothetical protein